MKRSSLYFEQKLYGTWFHSQCRAQDESNMFNLQELANGNMLTYAGKRENAEQSLVASSAIYHWVSELNWTVTQCWQSISPPMTTTWNNVLECHRILKVYLGLCCSGLGHKIKFKISSLLTPKLHMIQHYLCRATRTLSVGAEWRSGSVLGP